MHKQPHLTLNTRAFLHTPGSYFSLTLEFRFNPTWLLFARICVLFHALLSKANLGWNEGKGGKQFKLGSRNHFMLQQKALWMAASRSGSLVGSYFREIKSRPHVSLCRSLRVFGFATVHYEAVSRAAFAKSLAFIQPLNNSHQFPLNCSVITHWWNNCYT